MPPYYPTGSSSNVPQLSNPGRPNNRLLYLQLPSPSQVDYTMRSIDSSHRQSSSDIYSAPTHVLPAFGVGISHISHSPLEFPSHSGHLTLPDSMPNASTHPLPRHHVIIENNLLPPSGNSIPSALNHLSSRWTVTNSEALYQTLPQQQESPSPEKRPTFLIIGLFALRLAKRLIESLSSYPERIDDLTWLTRFLSRFSVNDALAKIWDEHMDEYVSMYPAIVARFIRQPQYPFLFLQMNPELRITNRPLTDSEARDIVDFADAAGEWGSVVKIPGNERERIERVASQRQMARR